MLVVKPFAFVCQGFVLCKLLQACKQCEAKPGDAVLLAKEYVHTTCLSQLPELLLPQELLPRLQVPLEPHLRNPFSIKTQSEFAKTAAEVAKEPWGLERSRKWLEELLRKNRAREVCPPELSFFNGNSFSLNPAVVAWAPPSWREYAPGQCFCCVVFVGPNKTSTRCQKTPTRHKT